MPLCKFGKYAYSFDEIAGELAVMVYQHVYSDFDAFVASINGLDFSAMAQSVQRQSWSLSRLRLEGVIVQAGAPGSGGIGEGSTRPGTIGLYLPSPGACSTLLNGELCATDCFIVLPPGSSYRYSTSQTHEWCMVTVPSAALPGSVDCTDRAPSAVAGGCRVSTPNPRMAKRFRKLVHQVLASAGACERFEASPAARNAAVAALEIVASFAGAPVPARSHSGGRPRVPRREIVDRCLALLEARQAGTTTLNDLCAAAGVSERSLRNIFHEYFGVCPRKFLRLRRMNSVRRALSAAEPDAASVTEVLVRHGEWELGRFAVMYRQLFGERPSETLRRSPTRATVTLS